MLVSTEQCLGGGDMSGAQGTRLVHSIWYMSILRAELILCPSLLIHGKGTKVQSSTWFIPTWLSLFLLASRCHFPGRSDIFSEMYMTTKKSQKISDIQTAHRIQIFEQTSHADTSRNSRDGAQRSGGAGSVSTGCHIPASHKMPEEQWCF